MKNYFLIGKIEVIKATARDAFFMYELIDRNRQRLVQVFPWANQIRSSVDQEKFYDQAGKLWDLGEGYHFVLKFDGKHIGAVSVHSIVRDRQEVQFGYWIDEEYEGRGIVSTSIRAVEAALIEIRLTRHLIRFHQFNSRSKRVAEILGFSIDEKLTDGNGYKVFKKVGAARLTPKDSKP